MTRSKFERMGIKQAYVSGAGDDSKNYPSIEVTFNGKTYTVPPEYIFIWNDITVQVKSSQIYSEADVYGTGESRLYPLSDPVSCLMAAYSANNALLSNYGAMGLITNEKTTMQSSVPMLPSEKTDLQEQWKKKNP
jgi:hypothetical protein